jgi:hypothetical protein
VNAFVTIRALAAIALAPLVAASTPPSLFDQTQGGMWQVDKSGAAPVRLCLANTSALAVFEHRNANCTRNVIRDSGAAATIRYTCQGGDFGQSSVTLLTPRSMRIETQGISANAPFNYVLQAHRVGDCPAH